MWGSHHCQFSEPPVMCRQYCRLLAPTGSVSWANTAGLWLEPTVMLKQTLPACGSSRQWCSSQHCRLMARANSDPQANTAGSWLKPIVILKPTLLACGSSQQWCSSQYCRLELWTGSVAQDIIAGLTCKPAVISFSYFIVLYNLFFIFLVESSFTLYSLRRRQVHQY